MDLILRIINTFNNHFNIPVVENILDFQTTYEQISSFNENSIFNGYISELNLLDKFDDLYSNKIDKPFYFLALIKFLLKTINDKTTTYTFIKNKENLWSFECLKKKINDICVCLRNKEIRHSLREMNPDLKCRCGLIKYKDQKEITHHSYGENKWPGNFCFPVPDVLYNFITESEFANNYNFMMTTTSYFRLFFDLDFKISFKKYIENNSCETNPEIILDQLLKRIDEILTQYTNASIRSYIVSDKANEISDITGIHLFYPNIILSRDDAIILVNLIIDKNPLFGSIIDSNVYKGGLMLLFQEKNGKYYKINNEKSTYSNIGDSKIDQLKLTNIQTNETCRNFDFNDLESKHYEN